MVNDLGLKLVAVTDSTKVKLYEAKGLKLTKKLEEFSVLNDKHHRGEKSQSHYHKGSGPSSLFEPHTSAKEIEHQEAARAISDHLEKILYNNPTYNGLVITAEPKMLGHLRHAFSKQLKHLITKEIAKDLTHQDMAAIEHSIFS